MKSIKDGREKVVCNLHANNKAIRLFIN
jgi:hypothetical protein